MRRMLVAIATLGLCLVSVGSAGATFPGTNGRIAYLASDFSLHTMLPTGAGDRQITPAHFGSGPSWSPNGRRIAFIGAGGITTQSEIYSMAADGTDLSRLTHNPRNDYNPAYSPSGHRVLFGRDAPVGPVVMTMRTDGSDVRRLGQGVSYDWSPNGKWITYVIGSTARHRPSVWAMHPDGSDKHRLVFLGLYGGVFDDYSPDGKHFLFTRCGDYKCGWFVARADGSHVHPAPCDHISAYAPDGKWFLGGVENSSGGFDLARVSVASCSRKRITSREVLEAAWQSLPTP